MFELTLCLTEVRNPLANSMSNSNSLTNGLNVSSKPKEPIYESIKPRPEPLGGPADDGQNQVIGHHRRFHCSKYLH